MSVPAGFWIWLLCGVGAAFAAPSESWADARGCPSSRSEIATDRPDVTNSSLVVPTGSLQSENGVNLSARRDAQMVDGTNSRLRLGVAPCLEVLVDLPSYVAAPRGRGNSAFDAASGSSSPLDSAVPSPLVYFALPLDCR